MNQVIDNHNTKPPNGRLITGGIVFITGFLSPLLIPWVLSLELSTSMKTLISGLLALGIPELFMIIAAAILGKPGFNYLKTKIFTWLKKYGPPDTVSLLRYRIGLIIFSFPILLGFILPYVWELIPFIKQNLFLIIISGDVMFFSSLLLLGGNFWDKLRSLFIYKSRAVLITDQPENLKDHV
jgi:hypothetical protein